jgi:hypothetical protein
MHAALPTTVASLPDRDHDDEDDWDDHEPYECSGETHLNRKPPGEQHGAGDSDKDQPRHVGSF